MFTSLLLHNEQNPKVFVLRLWVTATYKHNLPLFEDGTVSFLDIIALRHGFDALERLGVILEIFSTLSDIGNNLSSFHHGNGQQLAKIYCEDNFDSADTQGAIVDKMAQLYDVHLRTGCFCNIGACQKYLGLSSEQIKSNFEAGHVCGDDRDLIDGKPTGSIRISFGYMSTVSDAQRCLQFIGECFLEGVQNKSSFIQYILQTSAELEPIKVKTKTETSTLKSFKNNQSVCEDFSLKEHSAVLSNQNISSEPMNKQYEMSHESVTRSFDQSDCSLHFEMDVNKMEVNHIIQSCTENNRRLTNIYLYPVKSCGAFQVMFNQ
ncbi:hypothetical protein KUTeg_015053 [Tegillarca granosa]|uniref:Molybdenum cofactor sulfurase n=1 Tax=Tegillarca granosa TaxID=220873 RepID=A0ABQ9EP27_TEGGR|nr:hypothetical protein KUTeg_015053 [Tegillarca granosa]